MFSLLCVNGECVLGKKTGAAMGKVQNAANLDDVGFYKEETPKSWKQTVNLNKMQYYSLTQWSKHAGSPRVIYQLHRLDTRLLLDPGPAIPLWHCLQLAPSEDGCTTSTGSAFRAVWGRGEGVHHPLGCDHHCTLLLLPDHWIKPITWPTPSQERKLGNTSSF